MVLFLRSSISGSSYYLIVSFAFIHMVAGHLIHVVLGDWFREGFKCGIFPVIQTTFEGSVFLWHSSHSALINLCLEEKWFPHLCSGWSSGLLSLAVFISSSIWLSLRSCSKVSWFINLVCFRLVANPLHVDFKRSPLICNQSSRSGLFRNYRFFRSMPSLNIVCHFNQWFLGLPPPSKK